MPTYSVLLLFLAASVGARNETGLVPLSSTLGNLKGIDD